MAETMTEIRVGSSTPNEKYPLPEGWRWVRLGEVCEMNPSRPKNFIRSFNAPTTFVPMVAVDERTGTIAKPEVVSYSKVSKGYTYFVEGDVLFAKITPCMQNGKHAIARNLIDGIGFGTTEFHVMRPKNEVLSNWIWYFVRQPHFQQEAIVYFTGVVGQQRVPDSFLSNYLVPLPSLPVQQRITAKLQALMQEIERARTACERQLEAAKALPATYLREVFESEEAKRWERKRLGEVVKEFVNGGTPSTNISEYWDGNIPWITGADVTNFWISGGRKCVTEKGLKNSATHLVPKNTVLVVTRTGVGKVGIAANDLCFSQDITGIICSEKIYSEYLARFISSQASNFTHVQRGATIKGLIRTDLENLELPLPPLLEQTHIAAELKEKIAHAEKLRAAIEKQLEAINAIPHAILRKAFRGEL